MKLRLADGVFLRHSNDESIACCFHTGGCTVLKNAEIITGKITHEWQDVDKIKRDIASEIECDANIVADGVDVIVAELISQRFVEIESSKDTGVSDDVEFRSNTAGITCDEIPRICEEDWTPFDDFYMRHGLPSELHMDLTDGCNEQCIHCYLPRGGTNFIDTDVARKVLKEFREAQGLTVFVSGGECMLHRNFASILKCAKELDLNIVVLSNLTMCDAEMVKLLKEIDPQFVNVSLYAVNESVHDSITQVSGSCRKTKAAIDALQAAGVHIRIATPFMHKNRNCVEELCAYAAEHHVHLIADCEIFGQTDQSCINQRHALSIGEVADLVTANREVFARGCMKPEACACDAKVCDIGDFRLNIDAEGKYYPCDGFHGAIIGDARKDSLWDVWTGEPLNKLRRLRNQDFESCANCADRAWCKVCPMRNYNETGNMFIHAPWRCEATRLYRRIFEEK